MPRRIRDYKAEQKYDGQPHVIKKRAQRNKARRMMKKANGGSLPPGKDVHHKTPMSKGGKTIKSNLALIPASNNRSYRRRSDGSMA